MDFELLKKTAHAAGITEIELYTKYEKTLDLTAFDNEISEKTVNEVKTFCIRGVYNKQLVSIYTEKDSPDEIASVIKQIQMNAQYLENSDPYFIYGGDKEYHEIEEVETDFITTPISDKLDLLLNITRSLQNKTKDYFHAEANYCEVEGEISIENSNGLNVVKKYSYAGIVAELVIAKNGEMADAYKIKYIKKFSDYNLDEITSEL